MSSELSLSLPYHSMLPVPIEGSGSLPSGAIHEDAFYRDREITGAPDSVPVLEGLVVVRESAVTVMEPVESAATTLSRRSPLVGNGETRI